MERLIILLLILSTVLVMVLICTTNEQVLNIITPLFWMCSSAIVVLIGILLIENIFEEQ